MVWPWKKRELPPVAKPSLDPELDDLASTRLILVTGEIDQSLAKSTIMRMLFLQNQGTASPIHIEVDSPGGVMDDGLAIFDIIRFVNCPVYTHCPDFAAGIAVLLLASGGKRSAYRGARVQLVPVVSRSPDVASDDLIKTTRVFARCLAERCHVSPEVVAGDMAAGKVMDAEETLAYGLIDHIVG